MLRAALTLLLASARPTLDAAALAWFLGLDPPAEAPIASAQARGLRRGAPPDWPAQVLGTLVSPTPRYSLAAVFYLPERSVVTLAVGDVLAGAEVVEIARGALVLRTADGLRFVPVNPRVPPPPPEPPVKPKAVVSAEREIRRDALDVDRLMTGARGMPAFAGGALVGIRLASVVPGSI
jgi:hypothetical protein